MSTLAQIKPNQAEKATEALKKFKYDVPQEIREDEAHLNHIIVAQSVPNARTMEFDTTAKVVKLNNQSLEVMKSHLPKYGVVVVLHDAKQYKAEKVKADQEAKAKEEADAAAEAEAKVKADQEAAEKLKAKDDEIAELKKKLEAKQPKEAVKESVKEEVKAETAAEAPKTGNGKG